MQTFVAGPPEQSENPRVTGLGRSVSRLSAVPRDIRAYRQVVSSVGELREGKNHGLIQEAKKG